MPKIIQIMPADGWLFRLYQPKHLRDRGLVPDNEPEFVVLRLAAWGLMDDGEVHGLIALDQPLPAWASDSVPISQRLVLVPPGEGEYFNEKDHGAGY